MSRTTRHAGLGLIAVVLLSSTTAVAASADTTTDDPAQAAAGWLTTQLRDGDHVHYDEWDVSDAGLTSDVLYALAAVGVASGTIDAIADWLGTQTDVYTGPGATAKLILAADVAGRDPHGFGPDGADLVATLEALEIGADAEEPDGPVGLYDGEFDSTLNQALAVLALARVTDAAPSAEAVGLLTDQQCTTGGFSQELLDDGASCDGGNVDATALAIEALLAVGEDDVAGDALAWLVETQAEDGSFTGDAGPSSNSTGLAALALRVGGETAAADAARDWLLARQAGCDTDTPGAFLADPDGAGETLRATPQALLGIVGTSLATLDAAGAGADVPTLDCPTPVEERDIAVTCDGDGEVAPGDRVACSIAGLVHDEAVHVVVTLNPTLLDTDVQGDADGVAAFAFDVPSDAAEGDTITIRVEGDGDVVLADLTIGVGAVPGDDDPVEGSEAEAGELPRTGAPPLAPIVLAGLTLTLGGGVLVIGRRRSDVV